MFTKTFCKPSTTVTVIPLGLTVTLQYNKDGLLEKVLYGYEEGDVPDLTDKLLPILMKTNLVPKMIQLKGGTTFVEGVFYTNQDVYVTGQLPDCNVDEYLEVLSVTPSSFTFYAFNVQSLAADFSAFLAISQWLKLNKFNTLFSYVVPAQMNDAKWESIVNTDKFLFKYPLISGIYNFDNDKNTYIPQKFFHQWVVSDTKRFLDENGDIKVEVTADDSTSFILDISDVTAFNIQPGSLVVSIDRIDNVVYSAPKPRSRKILTRDITCEVCGAPIIIPKSGSCSCSDNNCISKAYNQVSHMLSVLDLPALKYSEYLKLARARKIITPIDVLDLPQYKEAKFSLSIDKLLEAVVPVTVCADKSLFMLFANTCSNSVNTFRYYIENPIKLINFNHTSIMSKRLVTWLSDSYNASLVCSLLDRPNMTVSAQVKKFDGAPIFRGKTIAITGMFAHGSLDEVASILRSYDAVVTTNPDDNFQCLLVGDIKENIDGRMIFKSRTDNIVALAESDFFSRYDIDNDLAANLL